MIVTFNTPLEMQDGAIVSVLSRVTFFLTFQYSIGDAALRRGLPTPWPSTAFQYSIGDADVLQRRMGVKPPEPQPFNTPLEMRSSLRCQVADRMDMWLSILHWRCTLRLQKSWRKRASGHFQYSIGDAEGGRRAEASASPHAFNTPLEMRRRTPSSRGRHMLCFQYSIGDACSVSALRPGGTTSFNTPLEMQSGKQDRLHLGRLRSLSILHWRCGLDLPPLRTLIIALGFQYSIGDAKLEEMAALLKGVGELSILHWRCGAGWGVRRREDV